MDSSKSKQAVDPIFDPAIKLLARYRRYADEQELDYAQVHVANLRHALCLAHTRSDIYNAQLVRNELRELCYSLQKTIDQRKTKRYPNPQAA